MISVGPDHMVSFVQDKVGMEKFEEVALKSSSIPISTYKSA